MGYVGLPLAVEFAKVGFQVSGIDVSESKIVAVGMAVTSHPPHRPVLAGTTAYGSYLGCGAARRLASKRTSGYSCVTRGMGNQWSKIGPNFFQVGRR
jgi:hypothetical protein